MVRGFELRNSRFNLSSASTHNRTTKLLRREITGIWTLAHVAAVNTTVSRKFNLEEPAQIGPFRQP